MAKTGNKHNIKKMELVEIGEKLFLEKGYEETSIEDILAASGLSKGGFYHYFKSKEEVLVESISSLADNLLKELEPIVEDQRLNAMEKLNLFMEKKIAFQKPKREFALYLSMVIRSDFTFYKFIQTVTQKYVDPFSRIIEQGAKEGLFDVKFPRETADILLRAITSVPQSLFFNDYIEDKSKSAKYKSSLEVIIARTLGIESKDLGKVYDR